MYNLDTPIWQLTVGEFIELQKKNVINISNVEHIGFPQRNLVYGISGLAKLLNCSNATAQKVKNSGKIDKAYTQVGRQIVFDADLVIDLLKKDKNRR